MKISEVAAVAEEAIAMITPMLTDPKNNGRPHRNCGKLRKKNKLMEGIGNSSLLFILTVALRHAVELLVRVPDETPGIHSSSLDPGKTSLDL